MSPAAERGLSLVGVSRDWPQLTVRSKLDLAERYSNRVSEILMRRTVSCAGRHWTRIGV